jgi:hypothetical protein
MSSDSHDSYYVCVDAMRLKLFDGDGRENGFAFAGKPGNRIYSVGQCKVCNLALMNDKPIAREFCSKHEGEACPKPLPQTEG